MLANLSLDTKRGMQLGVLGLNHKLANLQLRERLAQACQRFFVTAGSIHGEHTFVLLTTCNRTEIYFSSKNLANTHSFLLQTLRGEIELEFDQKVYSYFGTDCFLHLARVTAGLDSAIVAETEIQGQVKSAYENATNCVHLPGEMHYLFQKCLKIGKQVRTSLPLGKGIPDLEHAIYQTGFHFFSQVKEAKVLLIGASDVNWKVLSYLKAKRFTSLTICNRSKIPAEQMGNTYHTKVLPWQELNQWSNYDWIIVGTKAPYHLVNHQHLPAVCLSHKLVMDLSVPRNVEPTLGKDPRITLLNIDQINRILRVRKQQMAEMLTSAERLVSNAVESSLISFCERIKMKGM